MITAKNGEIRAEGSDKSKDVLYFFNILLSAVAKVEKAQQVPYGF